MKKFSFLLLVASLFLGTCLVVYGAICDVQFVRGCEGHLKRCADANTIELAEAELRIAVEYLESEGLTEGSTHLYYSMPDRDIGFWYTNLRASLDELEATPEGVDRLTVSNQLIKLRETLLDHGEKRARVTMPPRIHVYPNQLPFHLLELGSMGGLATSAILFSVVYENEKKSANGQTSCSLGESSSSIA